MVLPLRRPLELPKRESAPRPKRRPNYTPLAVAFGAGLLCMLVAFGAGWSSALRYSHQEAFYRVLSDALARAQRLSAMVDSLGADYALVRQQLRQERVARIRHGIPSAEIPK